MSCFWNLASKEFNSWCIRAASFPEQRTAPDEEHLKIRPGSAGAELHNKGLESGGEGKHSPAVLDSETLFAVVGGNQYRVVGRTWVLESRFRTRSRRWPKKRKSHFIRTKGWPVGRGPRRRVESSRVDAADYSRSASNMVFHVI